MSAPHPARAGIRSTLVGVIANAVLAAGKALAGILGNSAALVADAIESTSDIATSLIVLGGLRVAQRPPDEDHPYGHGKAEPLAALAVAVALLAAAGGIVVTSIRGILIPHPVPEKYTLAVLLGVIVIKETLFRFVWRSGHETGSGAVKADAWHHRSDAITSAVAAVGIVLAIWWNYPPADEIAALFGAAIIAFNGVRLAQPAIMEITDAAPPAELEALARRTAQGVPGVMAVEKCRLRKMGFDFYVDIHVVVDGAMSVRDGHAIAHGVKDALRGSKLRVADALVHVEPNDAERLARARKFASAGGEGDRSD
ncbi:MAG: cation diffusion facilitator family transporter [Planctomycetota bacterium]